MNTDFDFLFGAWTIHNRYLKGRLRGSTEWIDFPGRSTVQPLLQGLGNLERYFTTFDGRPLEGVNLRLLDPATGEWSINWSDTARPGVLLPPMTGRFISENEGEFFGNERVDGKTVRCRFRWLKDAGDGSPRWEQAFSDDGGATWETNWIMTFTREAA